MLELFALHWCSNGSGNIERTTTTITTTEPLCTLHFLLFSLRYQPFRALKRPEARTAVDRLRTTIYSQSSSHEAASVDVRRPWDSLGLVWEEK